MNTRIYAPLISDVRMSDYGYWIVDVSVAPAATVSIMVCTAGITIEQARQDALASLPAQPRGYLP